MTKFESFISFLGIEEAEGCPSGIESDCSCGNPGTPVNGCSRIVSWNPLGCTFEFSCKPGYRLEGSRQWRCTIVQVQGTRPTCIGIFVFMSQDSVYVS